MAEILAILDELTRQHDEHMKHAYTLFLTGEDVSELWAYGAGLQHAIRSLQDVLA